MNLTIISFYTKDWLYEHYSKLLKKDCDRLGLQCKIEELPSTNSYLKNTCLKPQFILDKLIETKAPVLWVDVDGTILKKPIFFENNTDQFDFAAKKMPSYRKRTWHVGTMWFNYTPAMLAFLENWIINTGNISDESGLEKTWRENKLSLRTSDIPQEYFIIEPKNKMVPTNTVIFHRISSGLSKKKELPMAIRKGKKGIL